MDIESFREYCLSLPHATEDMPFDDTVVVFRIKGKIFACICLDKPDFATMKCDPERATELREQYSSIEGAWHWNKKYWNQVTFRGDVSDELFRSLVRHAYNEVNKKLPKKERVPELPIPDTSPDYSL
ncbi:MAG: MmcQ/YjbR family DNA-binding protein [Bacteroidales bacterium]|nr:MmcQ/YjbR family DNA-binding protein [Bacteroidales bacterium]